MPMGRSRWAILVAGLATIAVVGVAVIVVRPWTPVPACPAITDHPDWSVARRWDEALLDAIRRALPAPTVHARNLFHASATMWDAWAAYDPGADGYFVDEKHEADDVAAAREAAISYAAYRILLHRYSLAAGLEATFDELVDTMESLCYRIDYTATEGDSPAA